MQMVKSYKSVLDHARKFNIWQGVENKTFRMLLDKVVTMQLLAHLGFACNTHLLSSAVCVCVCVRTRVRACLCVCAKNNQSRSMKHEYTGIVVHVYEYISVQHCLIRVNVPFELKHFSLFASMQMVKSYKSVLDHARKFNIWQGVENKTFFRCY